MKRLTLILILTFTSCSSYKLKHLIPVDKVGGVKNLTISDEFLGDQYGIYQFKVKLTNRGKTPVVIERKDFLLNSDKENFKLRNIEEEISWLNHQIGSQESQLSYAENTNTFNNLIYLFSFTSREGKKLGKEIDENENEIANKVSELDSLYLKRKLFTTEYLLPSTVLAPGESIIKRLDFMIKPKDKEVSKSVKLIFKDRKRTYRVL